MQYHLNVHGKDEIIDIHIPEDVKSVGIFVSGGADSAILLSALAKEIQNRDVKLKAFTVSRVGASAYARMVIDAVTAKFGVPIEHVPNTPNPDAAHGSIRPALRHLLPDDSVDMIFTGVNDNPPRELVVLNEVYPNRPKGENPYPKIHMPFLPFWKSHVIALAKELDVLDIVALTHSCTERQIGRCGHCFQCDERRWAFEVNGIENPPEPIDQLNGYIQL